MPISLSRRLHLLPELRRHEQAQADEYAEAARRLGSPCLAGCHGCCHRLVLVDLADALGLAQHLLDGGAATPELRRSLVEDAGRAEGVSPDEYFAAGTGCVFLDRSSPSAACAVYAARPHDCRIWFVHGVPDGSWCAPGAAERELANVTLPELEATDLRFRARWRARQSPVLVARPMWVPLALGVLAALDLLDQGPAAMAAWQARLDAATQRSFALVDPPAE